MNARLIGGGVLVAVALSVVPAESAPVPVVTAEPETLLCRGPLVDAVAPRTLFTAVVAGQRCAEWFGAEVVRRIQRGLGVGEP